MISIEKDIYPFEHLHSAASLVTQHRSSAITTACNKEVRDNKSDMYMVLPLK